jgi:hypothetical protein
MDRLLKNIGFRIHLIVYAAVNALLMVINLLSPSNILWIKWPAIGWGLGVIGHAFLMLRGEKLVRLAVLQRALDEQRRI